MDAGACARAGATVHGIILFIEPLGERNKIMECTVALFLSFSFLFIFSFWKGGC